MAKRKGIAEKWRITSMTEWDNEFIDAEVQGYIDFAKDGLGNFQFGYVRCDIDWREAERDGALAVEFSFEGMDEMDPCSGRGWAALNEGKLDGKILFHRGDESGFVAERERSTERSHATSNSRHPTPKCWNTASLIQTCPLAFSTCSYAHFAIRSDAEESCDRFASRSRSASSSAHLWLRTAHDSKCCSAAR